ncbi:kelch-like protein 7 [Arctopsyche grandis]|uniref:kelch-like protein 7 n=1 Tax=Arctopsyche grandis TaxID=121162 RepID=UPI00406D7CB4
MITLKTNPKFANTRIEHLYDCMKSQKHADVVFAVRNRSIFAHMVVLSGCSAFFENNLNQLSDIFSSFDDEVIDAVLKYCYIGEILIDETRLNKFMELANTLLIKNVTIEEKAPQYQTVDLSNCLEVLRLSYNPTAKKIAMDLTLENFLTLCKTSEFLRLPASTLAEILKSDNLNVSSEEDVFKSVKLWTDYDITNRKYKLLELLSSVRLTLLSIMFLTTEVMVYCYSSPECMINVNQAMQTVLINRQNSLQKDNYRKRSAKLAIVSSWSKSGVENTIDIYDKINNNWALSKDLGLNRWNYETVVVDDCILIIGGHNDAGPVNAVQYIDLKDGRKYGLNPLNLSRNLFAAAKLSQDSSTDVYAIGGAESWLKPMNTVERWNSKRRNWETNVAPLPVAVHSQAASVINGNIYVTGGYKLSEGKLKSIREVQKYSPQTNSWSYLTPMIENRRAHKSADINGKLYVVGGAKDITLSHIASVESYDLDADLWTLLCNLPSPRWGTVVRLFDNKLLFIGGHDEKTYLSDVLEYDVLNKKWCTLKSLSAARGGGDSILIPYNSVI